MPTNIRWMLSIVVVLVSAAMFFFESQAGTDFLQWFVVVLGALMVGAVWLFPEAKQRDRRKT